jgi:hypothetical protein
VIVEALSDVRRVRRGVPIFGRRRISGVTLHVDALGPTESRRMQDRMNARLMACGCAEGSVFMLGTLIVAISVLVITSPGHRPTWILMHAAAVFPLLIIAGLAGKASGLMMARIRFHYLCDALARRLRAGATR